ncbi:class I SAM-dependent methyltransferase [Bacillus sp. 196mf]|uniref:class I SAM-dependent methyltransferase n=1 Tax=Bacillus sp. 196mf TaxID=1761754 RepID=UPI000D7C44C8|nr:class I SAM-dependent methyltransferase [Bacillus sp. 196mf]PYE87936.1 methyltransferase family protein [Bacillus sp. 196mf]
MTWNFYKPKFEFEDDIDINIIKINSAWLGHLHFAYDLIRFVKPKVFVELGTHYGASFFSFCQGVKDETIDTKCFAIDTWTGDLHTGPYGEEVFDIVNRISTNYYKDISILIRSTFDGAIHMFEDETIDILHIDGCHMYEAVTHDFEMWLPKISKNGIVLFHDISVTYRNNFGVYKLWDILKYQYPYLQFEHSFGLGVLFPKGYNNNFINIFKNKEELQQKYSLY